MSGEGLRRDWRVVICSLAVLALTAFTHLLIFYESPRFLYPDSTTYLLPADQMLRGNGFAERPGVADTIRTPGYPAFLAALRLLGLDVRGMVLVQQIASIAFSLLLFGGALAMTRSLLAATVAGLLSAIDPTTLRYSNVLLTEPLFTILLFLIVVLVAGVRAEPDVSRIVVIGLLSGILTLIRPAAILYPVVLLLTLLFRVAASRRIVVAAALILSSALLPFAWCLRNYAQTGVFVFCSIAGTNLLLHRAAGALAIEDGGDFQTSLTRHQNELLAASRSRLHDHFGITPTALPHAIQGRQYALDGRSVILHHLPAYIRLTARGVKLILLEDDGITVTALNDTDLDDDKIMLVVHLFMPVILLLALTGTLLLARRERPVAFLLSATILYFVFIAAGAEAESRFRDPIVPEMVLLAGIALAAAADSISTRVRTLPPPLLS